MGGLGKTTLAKMVYHHSDIRRHFDGFAWASISQQFQPRDVWEGLLFKLISPSENERERIKRLRDDELVKELYEVQLEKKCLVILDDIWRTEAWDRLRPAFPVGKASSKMLLTTRNKEVAQYVDDGRGFLHEPRFLTEDESWELLQKKALPGKDDPGFRIDTNMEKLGRQMVGRCAGLPLAIIVLGGLLATKHTLPEWDMVHVNINSHLRRRKGHEKQHLGVHEVLALSYHELPYQLKSCFLHLGHFPEDFEIPKKKLVRMWVAEGVVSPIQDGVEGEETLEDVAERYLGELIDRCMVQVGVRGSIGAVKTCRLHDLMRDLCLENAKQENYLKIVHLQDRNKQVDSRRVRRLAVHLGEEPLKIFPEQERTPYLWSLLFFSTDDYVTSISQGMKFSFNDFKLLKILDLEWCPIEGKVPRAIGKLIHLRYLRLTCYGETKIPSSMGNLRCLQTLILQRSLLGDSDIRIPNVIWKMERLRHLYLLQSINMHNRSIKLRLDNLTDLQTLQIFDATACNVKDLTKLTSLKKLKTEYLEIKELENVTLNRLCSLNIRSFSTTAEKTDLQRILSACRHLYKLELDGQIEKLPEYHQFPPNLTKLTLGGSFLEEDPMATLEKLPNLSILFLRWQAFNGKEMVCSSKGFPKLKLLTLWQLHSLEEWCVGKEAMPSLCELEILNCMNLKMVPVGLRFITTLKVLKIINMPKEFKKRVNEGGEDLYKVQHVPSVIIE